MRCFSSTFCMCYFCYQIVIPALMNVFIGNKLSSSIEKAQNVAAECALQDLGIPIEGE